MLLRIYWLTHWNADHCRLLKWLPWCLPLITIICTDVLDINSVTNIKVLHIAIADAIDFARRDSLEYFKRVDTDMQGLAINKEDLLSTRLDMDFFDPGMVFTIKIDSEVADINSTRVKVTISR